MKSLAADINSLNTTFLGFIDLTRPALEKGGIYWPAMVLVILSVAIQYIQSKQLLMTDKNSRSIRQIFSDTAKGKEVDQSEVQAATGKFTLFFIPVMLFVISVSLPSALSLYWLIGGLVAYWQQTRILKRDVDEMEATVDKLPAEAEILTPHKSKNKNKKTPAKKRKNAKRRR
jgi:membrane protein insertase Oxa1/YidC/SpoIIIJ